MSDEQLRQLERRWKETGAIEDEAAWLRARVQSGAVTEDRLRLAAYFGSAAASMALRDPPSDWMAGWPLQAEPWGGGPPMIQRPEGGYGYPSYLASWLHDLPSWDLKVIVRLLLGIARAALPAFEKAYPDEPGPRLALEDIEQALVEDPGLWRAALERWRTCDMERYERSELRDTMRYLPDFLFEALATLEAPHEHHPFDEKRLTGLSPAYLSTCFSDTRARVIHDHVRSDLVPVLLGYTDPVSERVQARGRDSGPPRR